MAKTESRGLRNRNPGNIRHNSSRFRGEVSENRDKEFKQFISMEWGYRAIFVILNTYKTKWGLETIREMITRWAPPSENHTDIYVEAVARRAMLDPDTPIDTRQRVVMLPLVAAMSHVENGEAASWRSVEKGWELFEVEFDLSATS